MEIQLPDHLNVLREELNDLLEHTMPNKSHKALRKTIETLSLVEQELQEGREHSRLAALYQISRSLSSSLNLDEVLGQVMDAVLELTGAERGFLMLYNSESGEMDLRAERNLEDESLEDDSMQISRSIIATVFDTGEPVVTTNAQSDPRFSKRESVIMYALRSIMCAPLRSRGKNIGVIYVDNRVKESEFSEDDLELLNTFAVQAAIALDNARLFTQTDEILADRIAELETITHINARLNEQLELAHVVHITQEWAGRETNAQQSWVALQTGEAPVLVVQDGEDESKLLALNDPLVAPALGQNSLAAFEYEGQNYLVAPMLLADELVGVLAVSDEQPFGESEERFLARLADRAASAIQNARLYEAVQQANQAKSKFVSVVSHELRLPMTSIKGYTDLLIQGLVGEINAQQEEFLHVIRNNVERMSALVSDLSDISRIETGRLRLESGQVSLEEAVKEVMGSLKPKLTEKNQQLDLTIPEDLPHVYADSNRLMQVLTNLISNAWKYTPEGGTIQVEASEKDGMVHTVVVDNGIGIAPEDQAQLFEQFFRSEDSKVREQQGWGLGLNVTRQLVQLMGGEIGFESEPGEGSTFWFTLPIASDDE